MELKLQQAIVATKAGRTDVAQSLLTQLIRENPNDANAWFLLGHIVDTPERQALYLQKTIELEPEHAVAKQRLMQLENGPVPAPVLPLQPVEDVSADPMGQETLHEQTLVETASVAELTQGLEEHNGSGLEGQTDQEWSEVIGPPVREKRETTSQVAAGTLSTSNPSTEMESDKASGEVWLVRTLVIMVIVAAIVLGILVLLILI